MSLTVDGYRINIDDRIVLSENLTQTNVRDYLQSQGFIGVGGGRFFINGVDTETTGVDIVRRTAARSRTAPASFDFTLAGNYNKTDVTKVPQTAQLAALNPAPPLFDRVNVLTFEEGTPKTKFTAGDRTGRSRASAPRCAPRAMARSLDPGTTAALDFELGRQDGGRPRRPRDTSRTASGWRSARRTCSTSIRMRIPTSLNTTGNTPFSNYSPFGRSGRFVYGRLAVTF